MKLSRTNLMLSDVENGSNLMLTRLPQWQRWSCITMCDSYSLGLGNFCKEMRFSRTWRTHLVCIIWH